MVAGLRYHPTIGGHIDRTLLNDPASVAANPLGQGAVGGSDGGGEHVAGGEVTVHTGGGAAFGGGPHDQRLTAAHVSGNEHTGHAGHETQITGDELLGRSVCPKSGE